MTGWEYGLEVGTGSYGTFVCTNGSCTGVCVCTTREAERVCRRERSRSRCSFPEDGEATAGIFIDDYRTRDVFGIKRGGGEAERGDKKERGTRGVWE